MPYFTTSAEWLEQSSLLLKARPSSTRITSKYTVLKPTPCKIAKRKAYEAKRAPSPADTTRTSSPPPQPQDVDEVTVTFTLKTYDPASGTSLKYETNKGAEVGRLIGNLGRLGRHMAALPELAEESAGGEGASASAPQADESGHVKMGGAPADPKAGTGTGGKKKKKGKK
ncbi:signal recognition particle srp9 protein [Pyrenophora teres f. maculata]|nr:signal recognition particle srp9 protein [Pyrenophora teres f. maculata]